MIKHFEAALKVYELEAEQIVPIDSSDHLVARVTAQGQSFLLKILCESQSEARVASRVRFLDHLREAGLNIPPIFDSPGGSSFATVQCDGANRIALMSEWIEGTTLSNTLQENLVELSGQQLGILHAASQKYEAQPSEDFVRWDRAYLPSTDGWLRRFLERPPVSADDIDVIHQALRRIEALRELPREPLWFGLIHADFHIQNQLFDGEQIWALDFDDCGWGHYLLDLTWPVMCCARHSPESVWFFDRFLAGYESVRPLSSAERVVLPKFVLAAGVAGVEMVHSLQNSNEIQTAESWYRFLVDWIQESLSA